MRRVMAVLRVPRLSPLFRGLCSLVFVCGLCWSSASAALAQKGATPRMHAAGTFDVNLTPLESEEHPEGLPLGRLGLDKQFHGDLEGTSKGQMLAAGTGQGSGGYVAIERVRGTLAGRRGTFMLQHSGTMIDGVPHLAITVVPGSGTGELAGISGALTITVDGGRHAYHFDYAFDEH